jgi:subtilase family serine protease
MGKRIFCAAIGLFIAHGAVAATVVAPVARINATIDDSKRIELKGNTRPEANARNDRGIVADSLPMKHMQLLLQRSPEQEHALAQYIDGLHDPKSPEYHRWLGAAEFGEQYGVATQDIERITAWLKSQHFTVDVVYPNAMVIDFSGTAGAVRAAFHTEIHRIASKGAMHIANIGDPQIPVALAPAVKGVVSLHDFRPRSMAKRRPKYTAGNQQFVAPADLATIYNFSPVFSKGISGQGQTIALVEDTDIYSAQDWVAFRNAFGLSSYSAGNLVQLHPGPTNISSTASVPTSSGTSATLPPPTANNNCADPGISSAAFEAILDAEWASAAAPSATIELVSCADTSTAQTYTFGGLIAIQNLLNANVPPPPVISMSYGECEAYNGTVANAAYSAAFQQAVVEGVSVFVSAGDEGAAGCDPIQASAYSGIAVNGFASTPYNVAVGGTDFGDTYSDSTAIYWNVPNGVSYGSAKGYVPEIPWNDSCAGALITTYAGFSAAFGASGFCNSSIAAQFPIDTTGAASGGPSNCATGQPVYDSDFTIVSAGTCKGAAKPSWQAGVFGLPSDGVRDLPDVSLFAANGFWNHAYVVCYSDVANGGSSCIGAPSNWNAAGGTSFAAPILAGIQALVNQNVGTRQGNPNYVYYKLAATQYGASGSAGCNSTNAQTISASCIFYDVTLGDIAVNCTGKDCYGATSTAYGVLSTTTVSLTPAYSTAKGWDFATGIGTVNVANLVAAWPPSP